MDRDQKKKIVEALIMASPEPVSAAALAGLVPHLKPAGVKELVGELNAEYESGGRAFEIWEVAGGYQVRTRPEFSGWLRQLQKVRPLRLSRAALETLAVVAYKQPVTRAEVEHVRGVEAGPVLRSLLDRRLVRIAGHREVPGRPMLYATSRRFLEVFGLGDLKDLPTLREIDELVIPDDVGASAEGEEGEGPGEDPEREAAVAVDPGELH